MYNCQNICNMSNDINSIRYGTTVFTLEESVESQPISSFLPLFLPSPN